MKCREIIKLLEKLAPQSFAESWDNCGMSYGDEDKELSGILVALEPTQKVIDEAVEKKANLIITHHPMIFGPIKTLKCDYTIGKKITKLAKNDIISYSMHTNMDVAVMASVAADKLELKDVVRLEQIDATDDVHVGLGSVGNVDKVITLEHCCNIVKNKFNIDKVRVVGDLQKQIRKIAILPGSGKSYIKKAIKVKADVLITGDIDYHSAVDALEEGICLIDAGHYDTEHFFVEYIYEYLKNCINDSSINIYMATEESPIKII